MKCITRQLDVRADETVEILPLADIHIGDKNSDIELVKKLIQTVRDIPNRYLILDGDLMNTAIVGSKSDVYSEIMTPSEELKRCKEIFEPIKDKILCVLPGNHEERVTKTTGVCMTEILCRELGIQSVYSPTSAVIFLKMGWYRKKGRPFVYTIYVNHGSGGGRKPGSKISRLADYASIVDADVFIVGHTHFPASFKQQTYRVNTSNSTVTLREQLFVNTASALSYGGYGDRQGYQPGSNSYPVITLSHKEKKALCTL